MLVEEEEDISGDTEGRTRAVAEMLFPHLGGDPEAAIAMVTAALRGMAMVHLNLRPGDDAGDPDHHQLRQPGEVLLGVVQRGAQAMMQRLASSCLTRNHFHRASTRAGVSLQSLLCLPSAEFAEESVAFLQHRAQKEGDICLEVPSDLSPLGEMATATQAMVQGLLRLGVASTLDRRVLQTRGQLTRSTST